MKLVKFLLILIAIEFSFIIPSLNANSAQTYFEGTTSSGVFITGNDSPIEVVSEDLVFDLENVLNGSVSATYTMRNTLDATIKAKFYFPFLTNDFYRHSDIDFNYDVLVNRNQNKFESVDKKLRLAFVSSDWYLESPNYLNSLKDFSNELKSLQYNSKEYLYSDEIYIYTLRFETLNKYSNDWYNVQILNDDIITETRVRMENEERYIVLRQNYDFSIYSFQKIDDLTSQLKVPNGCNIIKMTEEKLTLFDLVLKELEEMAYINDIIFKLLNNVDEKDIYNYGIDVMNINDGFINMEKNGMESLNFSDYIFVLFYDYEVEFKPYETLQNKVVTTLIPSEDYSKSPATYKFEYYLIPASTFKSFSDLKITIKTSKYLLEPTFEFDEVEGGYEKTFDSLPDKDLVFTLSDSLNPKEKRNNIFLWIIIICFVIALGLIGIGIGILLLLQTLASKIKKEVPVSVKKNIIIAQNVVIILSTLISLIYIYCTIIASCVSTLILFILSINDGTKIKIKNRAFLLLFVLSLLTSLISFVILPLFAFTSSAIVDISVGVIVHLFLVSHLIYNIKLIKNNK